MFLGDRRPLEVGNKLQCLWQMSARSGGGLGSNETYPHEMTKRRRKSNRDFVARGPYRHQGVVPAYQSLIVTASTGIILADNCKLHS